MDVRRATTLAILAIAAAAAIPAAASAKTTTLAYRVGDHHRLVLKRSGAALELRDARSGKLLARRALAGTSGMRVTGAPRLDDTLTIDFGGGKFRLPAGIHFEGGAGGYDVMRLVGGHFRNGVATGTGRQSGTFDLDGLRIAYSGLEPVEDFTPATNFTVNSSVTTTNFVAGPTSSGNDPVTGNPEPTYQVNFNGDAELINFRNKTNLLINGTSGADQISMNVPAKQDSALSTVHIDSGGAEDTISIASTPSGVATATNTANGTPNDNTHVGSTGAVGTGSLTPIAGALDVIDSGGVGNVILDDAANTTARNLTMSLDSPGVGRLSGTGAADITYGSGITGLNFRGGSGSNQLAIQGLRQGMSSASFVGNSDQDTYNVGDPSTGLDNFSPSATISFDGKGGPPGSAQTNRIDFDANGHAVTKSVPTGDILNIDDAGSSTGHNYSVSSTNFSGHGSPIHHDGIETTSLATGSGPNNVNVPSVADNSTISLQGGDGGNAVDLASTGTNSLFMANLGSGVDSATVHGTGAGAGIQLLGQGGSDNLTIESLGSGAGAVAEGGGAADVLALGSAPVNSDVRFNGDDGNDSLAIGLPGHALDDVRGNIELDGNANDATPTTTRSVTANGSTKTNTVPTGDAVSFLDDGSVTPNVAYSLSPTQFMRGSQSFGLGTLETIGIQGAPGSNALNVTGTPDSSTTTFTGGSSATTMTVGSTGASSNLDLTGGAAGNTLTVNGTGSSSVLTALAGGGADALTLDGTGAGAAASLDGGEGSDSHTAKLAGLGGVTRIADTGAAGTDSLVVDCAPDVTVGSSTVTKSSGQKLEFSGIEQPPTCPAQGAGQQPQPPGGQGPGTGGGTAAGLSVSAKVTNTVFAVGPQLTPKDAFASRAKRGTSFVYTLNAAARVTIEVQSVGTGRKKGSRCVKQTTGNRTAKRCKLYRRVQRMTRTSHTGTNTVAYSGRVRKRVLAPGSYRAVFTAVDLAGHRARSVAVRFRVVAG